MPNPNKGEYFVALPMELTLRLSLHWEIIARGEKLSGLALDLGQNLEVLDSAFGATQLAHRKACASSALAAAVVEEEADCGPSGRAVQNDHCGRVATWSNAAS